MRSKLLLIATILFIFSCKQEPKTNFVELDLHKHGVPFTIMAPEASEIKTMDLSVMKDITIKKSDENYYIQLYTSEANTTDVAKLKAEQVEDVKKNPYFSKMIEDYPKGFIYEKQIDSTNVSYAFKYLHVQGDQEFIFQNGLIGIFKLEDIKNMYGAVNQDEKK